MTCTSVVLICLPNKRSVLILQHVQVLVSAVHKPKQKWSIKSSSTLSRLKEWPIIQEYVSLYNRLYHR